MEGLVELKNGAVAHEDDFVGIVNEYFTSFCKLLFSYVNRSRKMVFSKQWTMGEREYKALFADKRRHSGNMLYR
jgi:hypothetical protein